MMSSFSRYNPQERILGFFFCRTLLEFFSYCCGLYSKVQQPSKHQVMWLGQGRRNWKGILKPYQISAPPFLHQVFPGLEFRIKVVLYEVKGMKASQLPLGRGLSEDQYLGTNIQSYQSYNIFNHHAVFLLPCYV